jgi:RNA polymerase sigma factor (sigma-70 family)
MTPGPRPVVPGRVYEWIAALERDALGDDELLQAYVTRRDVTAFGALMRRHGPLVYNICRGVLRNEHDAEDAFQATFLVLARKASSIRCLASLGGWLHKVAHHVALKARAAAQHPEPPPPEAAREDGDPVVAAACRELCEALDEEIWRLPDKYRLPLALCSLESLTTGEAARRLRWPVGTVKVRLMQARELLRKRLSRRGFTLSLGGLA